MLVGWWCLAGLIQELRVMDPDMLLNLRKLK
jgi:hypothetical protein